MMDAQTAAALIVLRSRAQAIADSAQTLALDLEDMTEAPETPDPVEFGTDLALTDMNGDPLHAGDRVLVSGSDRFGPFSTIVVNRAPALPGRNNPRAAVPHAADGAYTAGVQRVSRDEAATPAEFDQACALVYGEAVTAEA